MNASILSIGDEVLMGKITNTNFQYIARRLNEFGIKCIGEITCADNIKAINSSLDKLLEKSEICIVTGGLGITEDDITKQSIADYIGVDVEFNDKAYQNTIEYYKKRNIKISNTMKKFFDMPKNSTILNNKTGIAPGFIVSKGKKKIVVLPGPPRENRPMFEDDFVPQLKNWTNNKLVTKYFKIFGLRELEVVEKIDDLLDLADEGIFLTTYCSIGEVTLVMRYNSDEVKKSLTTKVAMEITNRFGKNLYAFKNIELEEALIELLQAKNIKFSVAESLTGGLISSKLVSQIGMGSFLIEGLVTYANEAKISRLGVDSRVIEENTAVSEEVAQQMVEGLLKNPLTNYAVATTGYAGPQIEDEEIGLCYIAVGTRENIQVKEHKFIGDRNSVRINCSKQALYYLINFIKYKEI